MEKALEIRVKADEEFAIEKVLGSAIEPMTLIPDISPRCRPNSLNKSSTPSTVTMRKGERAQRSLRRCELSRTPIAHRILMNTCTPISAQSTITNKSRLKLLHKREEILQQIFSALREPDTLLCDKSGIYEEFLEGVIAEGFMHIMDSSVTIHCRKSDAEKVEAAAAKASQTYKDLSGTDISFGVVGSMAEEWYVSLLLKLMSCVRVRKLCLVQLQDSRGRQNYKQQR
jgi:hypothetical protein